MFQLSSYTQAPSKQTSLRLLLPFLFMFLVFHFLLWERPVVLTGFQARLDRLDWSNVLRHFFASLLPEMKSFSALTRSASSFQPSILLRNRSLNQISNRQISSCINRGVIASSTSNLIPTSSTSTSSVNRFYLQTRFKSKKSKATSPTPSASDDDVPVMHTKGKGKKSGIGKESSDDSYSTSTRNDELPGEKFDIKKLTSNMANSLERANKTVSSMIGGHGRADPGEYSG